MNRRWFIGAVVILALFSWWSAQGMPGIFRANDSAELGLRRHGATQVSAPGLAIERRVGNYQVDASTPFTQAQALAFAWAGMVADGNATVDQVPAAARVEWDWAVDAVASQTLQAGQGQSMTAANGAGMRIERAPARSGTALASGSVTQAAATVNQLKGLSVNGTVVETTAGHRIDGDAACAGLRIEPGDQPLVLIDNSQGQHAFRIHGDNLGSVRVNDGLIIPGRSYAITGTVRIESAASIGVDIVPLVAVPEYHDTVFALPHGAG